MQEGGAQEVLLEGSELTQTFDGEQYQFRGVDVLLPRGSKQGLVGVNGFFLLLLAFLFFFFNDRERRTRGGSGTRIVFGLFCEFLQE